jgi:hypothetical protein
MALLRHGHVFDRLAYDGGYGPLVAGVLSADSALWLWILGVVLPTDSGLQERAVVGDAIHSGIWPKAALSCGRGESCPEQEN